MTVPIIAAIQSIDSFPIWILVVSVLWIIFSITRLKLHPFLAMMSGAILVGILSGPLPEPTIENKGLFHNRVDLQDAETPYSNPSLAVKWSLLGFGNTAGGVGHGSTLHYLSGGSTSILCKERSCELFPQ